MQRHPALTMRTPQFDLELIASHCAHPGALKAGGTVEAFGPFMDKSGGAYLLRAGALEQARAMAFADALHATGASQVSVRGWNVTQVAHQVE